MSSLPIGMFDSGVGGLTIMRELMRQLPNESIIYLADTKRLPYGNHDAETIIKYSLECSRFLIEQKIKLLIIACNTATSYAIKTLKEKFKIPVIGVIECTVKKAAFSTGNQRLAILATEATLRSKAYEKHIQALLPVSKIISIACPLFVPLIEEGFHAHPATQLIVREYLKNLFDQKIDTLLLGCTHYLFLSSMIQNEMGPEVCLIDSTVSCAECTASTLKEKKLHAHLFNIPSHRLYVSGDPIKFRQISEKLLDIPIPTIEKITLNRL